MWIWEHQGGVPGGDQKQEREEWHVEQNGSKISGYYDRIVHQVSTDGHAYRCSMALEFQIATRYQFSGDVSGDEVRIIESSFEVLSPSACDNGKRRLDVYQGKARATRSGWSGAWAARSSAARGPTSRPSGSDASGPSGGFPTSRDGLRWLAHLAPRGRLG